METHTRTAVEEAASYWSKDSPNPERTCLVVPGFDRVAWCIGTPYRSDEPFTRKELLLWVGKLIG